MHCTTYGRRDHLLIVHRWLGASEIAYYPHLTTMLFKRQHCLKRLAEICFWLGLLVGRTMASQVSMPGNKTYRLL
jgi:hypothetical protein